MQIRVKKARNTNIVDLILTLFFISDSVTTSRINAYKQVICYDVLPAEYAILNNECLREEDLLIIG